MNELWKLTPEALANHYRENVAELEADLNEWRRKQVATDQKWSKSLARVHELESEVADLKQQLDRAHQVGLELAQERDEARAALDFFERGEHRPQSKETP